METDPKDLLIILSSIARTPKVISDLPDGQAEYTLSKSDIAALITFVRFGMVLTELAPNCANKAVERLAVEFSQNKRASRQAKDILDRLKGA